MAIPKKNQLIGLDIGSHSVKLVEIDDARNGRTLKNFGMVGLPPEAIVEGAVKEMEVVSSAIRNLFHYLKVKNRNVAVSVSGFSVIVKKISVEIRPESGLEATIQEEAEQYVPFDMAEVNLDFDVLPASGARPGAPEAEGGGGTSEPTDVMLVAARKDIVEEYVSLVEMAGLNPGVMDVDAFALQNALEISDAETRGCYALVNVGAEELGINAIKDGISLFTRDSSYGGSQVNRAIMRSLKVGFEQAEKIKLGGVRLEGSEQSLKKIVADAVSEWVNEIKRALDFVAGTHPGEAIETVFLSGGASRTPGFKERLAEETRIPVKRFNPFANLTVSEKAFDLDYLKFMAPQAAVAVGLALRSIADK